MSKSIFLCAVLSLLALADAGTHVAPRAPQQSPNTGYNGGEDNPQDPSEAGAAGNTKGAFTLSQGGLIAIIVVAVVVAVVGASSAILFWLAKKRQWDVRNSIRRASRRFTGRSEAPKRPNRPNRRTGVRLDSPPPGRNARTDKDVEKGLPAPQQARTTTTITSQFDVETPTTKGWKSQVLGGRK